MELFCNAQQYNQMGVSWPTGSWLKHSEWLRLRLMDQSQEILLGHAIFASSEYGYRCIACSISNKWHFSTIRLIAWKTYKIFQKILWEMYPQTKKSPQLLIKDTRIWNILIQLWIWTRFALADRGSVCTVWVLLLFNRYILVECSPLENKMFYVAPTFPSSQPSAHPQSTTKCFETAY